MKNVGTAKEVRLTEHGVTWAGQTMSDGSAGMLLFGRDDAGSLHIRIVCDRTKTGGTVVTNEVMVPEGLVTIEWLRSWFDPPRTYVVTCRPESGEASA